MSNRNKKELILTSIVCLLPLIMSALLYSSLPDRIVVQFDLSGKPSKYMPKPLGAIGIPVFLALLNVIVLLRMYGNSEKYTAGVVLRSLWIWLVPSISVILQPVTLLMSAGMTISVVMIVLLAAGLLCMIVGSCLKDYEPELKSAKRNLTGILCQAAGLVVLVITLLVYSKI